MGKNSLLQKIVNPTQTHILKSIQKDSPSKIDMNVNKKKELQSTSLIDISLKAKSDISKI